MRNIWKNWRMQWKDDLPLKRAEVLEKLTCSIPRLNLLLCICNKNVTNMKQFKEEAIMKKRLFAIAMVSALAAGMMPVTSYAAEVSVIKEGNGYVVLGGQGMESLQQTLEEIGEYLGNNGIVCPEIPENTGTETPALPDIQVPEVCESPSEQPDGQTPEIPGTPEPTTPEPTTPEQPATSEQPTVPAQPATPDQPDIEEPETPVQPTTPDQTGQPETPVQSDTSSPDNGTSDEDINDFAAQVVDLVNAERVKAGLSKLKMDADITAAANVRAKEIKQSFSHTRPNGSSFSTALTEQGISYRGSGENIAWGQKSPEQVMDGWMNSDGHRANILNKNFKNIGVGYYQDEKGVNYWVQLFTY